MIDKLKIHIANFMSSKDNGDYQLIRPKVIIKKS